MQFFHLRVTQWRSAPECENSVKDVLIFARNPIRRGQTEVSTSENSPPSPRAHSLSLFLSLNFRAAVGVRSNFFRPLQADKVVYSIQLNKLVKPICPEHKTAHQKCIGRYACWTRHVHVAQIKLLNED